MDNFAIVGRSFGSDTLATVEEDGSWKVIVSMTERRRFNGKDWEEKKVSTMCTNNSFDKAYSTALDSTLRQYEADMNKNDNGSLFADAAIEEVIEDKEEK
jgi:hypothetical protein